MGARGTHLKEFHIMRNDASVRAQENYSVAVKRFRKKNRTLK